MACTSICDYELESKGLHIGSAPGRTAGPWRFEIDCDEERGRDWEETILRITGFMGSGKFPHYPCFSLDGRVSSH